MATVYHPAGLSLLSTRVSQPGLAFGYHGSGGNLGIALGPSVRLATPPSPSSVSARSVPDLQACVLTYATARELFIVLAALAAIGAMIAVALRRVDRSSRDR